MSLGNKNEKSRMVVTSKHREHQSSSCKSHIITIERDLPNKRRQWVRNQEEDREPSMDTKKSEVE
jgi:hypothetical protein